MKKIITEFSDAFYAEVRTRLMRRQRLQQQQSEARWIRIRNDLYWELLEHTKSIIDLPEVEEQICI